MPFCILSDKLFRRCGEENDIWYKFHLNRECDLSKGFFYFMDSLMITKKKQCFGKVDIYCSLFYEIANGLWHPFPLKTHKKLSLVYNSLNNPLDL